MAHQAPVSSRSTSPEARDQRGHEAAASNRGQARSLLAHVPSLAKVFANEEQPRRTALPTYEKTSSLSRRRLIPRGNSKMRIFQNHVRYCLIGQLQPMRFEGFWNATQARSDQKADSDRQQLMFWLISSMRMRLRANRTLHPVWADPHIRRGAEVGS